MPRAATSNRPQTELATLPLRERKRLKTAAAIYDAAIELMAERAYDEVSVDAICERAEVGRATFFRFYGSKIGLLIEFNQRLSDRVRTAIENSGETTAAGQLEILESTVATAWQESGPGLRALAAEAMRLGTPASGRELFPALVHLAAEIVAEGVKSGEFKETALSPDLVGWIIVTTNAACVATALRAGDKRSVRRLTNSALELLLTGLRA